MRKTFSLTQKAGVHRSNAPLLKFYRSQLSLFGQTPICMAAVVDAFMILRNGANSLPFWSSLQVSEYHVPRCSNG